MTVRAESGIARQAEDRFFVDLPDDGRLPGLGRDPVDKYLPEPGDHVSGIVLRPRGRACRDDHDIILPAGRCNRVPDLFRLILDKGVAGAPGTSGLQHRLCHHRVALHNLPGGRAGAGGHEFASRRDKPDPHRDDIKPGDTIGGKGSGLVGADPVAGWHHHLGLCKVLSCRADVLPRAGGFPDRILPVRFPDILDHDHRIVSGRDHIAGVHPGCLAERDGVLLGCAFRISARDRDTVHCRKVDLRHRIGAERWDGP